MSRIRSVIFVNILLFAGSSSLSLMTAEVVLRLLGYHGETVFRVQNTVAVNDAVLNWRHKPRTEFYFNDIVYQINERGFRDYIYTYGKPPNTFRIFLASDSIGFGTNVQMTDSYPKLLEGRLNKLGLPYHVEIINYSMPGLSLRQKWHIVDSYAGAYNQDLVILDYAPNDIEFESRKNPAKEKEQTCSIALIGLRIPCMLEDYAKGSALAFFIVQGVEGALHRINWEQHNQYYDQVRTDYYNSLYSRPEKIEYLKTWMARMSEYQKETGVRVLVPIFPVIYDFKEYKWESINDLIIRTCQDNGLEYVSLLDDFRKFDYNEMRVQRGDFTHPSIKGNGIAAEAIARAMIQKRLISKQPV